MRPVFIFGLLATALLATAPAVPDTLLLDAVDQARATSDLAALRGLSMRDVEARFGAPSQRRAAVGTPPITRWEYADFIVYFEHRHVIHAVRRRG